MPTKTLLQTILDKGHAVKSKNKWWGKIILFALASLIIAGLVLRKRGMDKKRAELLKEKNDTILELKQKNRQMQDTQFKDKISDIAAEIETKKERVKEIKQELKTIGANDVQEKQAFDAIRSWDTFNSYLDKS